MAGQTGRRGSGQRADPPRKRKTGRPKAGSSRKRRRATGWLPAAAGRWRILAFGAILLVAGVAVWFITGGTGPSGQQLRGTEGPRGADLLVAVPRPPPIGGILPAPPPIEPGAEGLAAEGTGRDGTAAGDPPDAIAQLIDELDAAARQARPAAATGGPAVGPSQHARLAVPPSVAVPPEGKGDRIAIVIDDLGGSAEAITRLMALPGPVTYSFLTVGPDAMMQADLVARAGLDVMLHLPMEPMGSADPGPNPLLVANDPEENLRRFHWHLDRMPRAIGVNNHMGSRFTADAAQMRPVLEAVRQAGLFWLDSRTSGRSVGLRVAQDLQMPAAQRDLFLDHDPERDAILAQLRQTERVAARKGQAIAIGHPYPETLAALEAWMPAAQARGFILVGMSDLIARPASPGMPVSSPPAQVSN